jgi:ssRNA-specific RNase YbeY (16S rRNA maturation enzyme)
MCILLAFSCGGVEDHKRYGVDDNANHLGLSEEARGVSAVHPDADRSWKAFPIPLGLDSAFSRTDRQQIQRAIGSWNQALGFEAIAIEESLPCNDRFPDLYSRLDDQANCLSILRDWRKTKKSENVLGTTIWLSQKSGPGAETVTADIILNAEHYLFMDANDEDEIASADESPLEIVDLESLLLHEFGHFLGLNHQNPNQAGDSIMKPSVETGAHVSHRQLARGDVTEIQKLYQDRR